MRSVIALTFGNDTASEIVQHISSGEWTASQVLEAYLARATLAHDLTNCLTEGWRHRSYLKLNLGRSQIVVTYFDPSLLLAGPGRSEGAR